VILYHLRGVAGRREHASMDRMAEVTRSIEEGLLYFSSPASFNDALDCRVENFAFDRMTAEEREQFVKERVQSLRDEGTDVDSRSLEAVLGNPETMRTVSVQLQCVLNQWGVLCLTSNICNDVVWSLYADRHAGIGLCLDVSEWVRPGAQRRGLYRVRYSDEPTPVLLGADRDVEALLATKSSYWSHESEYRFVSPDHTGWYRSTDLRGVIFGWRIDGTHRAALLDCMDRSSPQLRVWQAVPKPRHRALGFEIVREGAFAMDPEQVDGYALPLT
jgi:hypothetical protein